MWSATVNRRILSDNSWLYAILLPWGEDPLDYLSYPPSKKVTLHGVFGQRQRSLVRGSCLIKASQPAEQVSTG